LILAHIHLHSHPRSPSSHFSLAFHPLIKYASQFHPSWHDHQDQSHHGVMAPENHGDCMKIAREVQANFKAPRQQTRGRRGASRRLSLSAGDRAANAAIRGRGGGGSLLSSFVNRAVTTHLGGQGSFTTSSSSARHSNLHIKSPTIVKGGLSTSRWADATDLDDTPAHNLHSGKYTDSFKNFQFC
jgi:hypothetical protein